MTADTYKLPETWPEMTALKMRMQRDLLSRAIRENKHPSDAARLRRSRKGGGSMTKSNPTRSDDMHALEILHVIETQGTAAARAQFGISNGAVQGMRHRMLNPRNLPSCQCMRPENRDGGMPPRWWAA